ncbi:hypothetical protein BAUCODRAFT_175011 [Baudoinia panamericana UAMH 10762]|uniref:Uncharacterized protein n=1 Tax=Baudoinia panamericana (strain UAMH 10762) TaxID=717646 RepID=M2MUJ7_BAUPA|nr:uncharacterized protein BAUCODRAFT_175011 [Baudoinia panamericana UAMH 10762]EMD00597.1 hypothetical protein BAUCODRAFT_175011 [Baudoinia panamericana UAMH 10762]
MDNTSRASPVLSKRFSLSAIAAQALTTDKTTMFVTYTAELRSDRDVYMFGIDRCYTTAVRANQRVEVLAHCNPNFRSVETRLNIIDSDTGCMTSTWGRYGSQIRFIAQAKKVDMAGHVLTNKSGAMWEADGSKEKRDVGLFLAETQLDLADHVWVVAIHKPAALHSQNLMLARRLSQGAASGSAGLSSTSGKPRRPSVVVKNRLSRITETGNSGEPDVETNCDFGWSIDSVHSASDKAIARAKRVWNERFKIKGRCRKFREHYGFARYSLKPALITGTDAQDFETTCQVRIERVRVVPYEAELKELSILRSKPLETSGRLFVPPIRNVNGEIISTAAGRRTSLLRELYNIADEALGDKVEDDKLPLALKIRQDRLSRWASLSDSRYRKHDEDQDKAADAYHSYVHHAAPAKPNEAKLITRVPSHAFMRARACMAVAVRDDSKQHISSNPAA